VDANIPDSGKALLAELQQQPQQQQQQQPIADASSGSIHKLQQAQLFLHL